MREIFPDAPNPEMPQGDAPAENKPKRKLRRIIAIVVVLALIVLLTPTPSHYKDGGTVVYTAILYKVEKRHGYYRWYRDAVTGQSAYSFLTGTVITILGRIVYSDLREELPQGDNWVLAER